jgi:hypothetical protein
MVTAPADDNEERTDSKDGRRINDSGCMAEMTIYK